jgi:hypothetical protein
MSAMWSLTLRQRKLFAALIVGILATVSIVLASVVFLRTSNTIVVTVQVRGALEEYDEVRLEDIREHLASSFGVDVEDVVIDIRAGSVLLEVHVAHLEPGNEENVRLWIEDFVLAKYSSPEPPPPSPPPTISESPPILLPSLELPPPRTPPPPSPHPPEPSPPPPPPPHPPEPSPPTM